MVHGVLHVRSVIAWRQAMRRRIRDTLLPGALFVLSSAAPLANPADSPIQTGPPQSISSVIISEQSGRSTTIRPGDAAAGAVSPQPASDRLPDREQSDVTKEGVLSPGNPPESAAAPISDPGPKVAQQTTIAVPANLPPPPGEEELSADAARKSRLLEQVDWSSGETRLDAQVQEVARGLRAWKATFKTVDMVAAGLDRARLTAQETAFPADAPVDGTQWGYRSRFWYEDPFAMYFCHNWLVDGECVYCSKGTANGFRYWLAYSEEGQPTVFPHVRDEPLLRMATPALHFIREHPLEDPCRMAALRGLWWSPGCQWISEKLPEIYGIHYVGKQDVDGHSCIVLSSSRPSAVVAAESSHHTWFFDPEIQYLPRRFDISESSITGESLEILQTWQATDFLQAANGTWFPQQGFVRRNVRPRFSNTTKSSSLFEWKVLQLELDQPAPAETQQPPPISESTQSVNDDYVGSVEFPVDDMPATGMARFETPAQLQARLRTERNKQLGKDSLSLLLVILVVGALVTSLYAGYRRLSGGDLRPSA